jgi:hypothetical protein
LQGKATKGSTTLLTAEQKQAIQNFREEAIRIRTELRAVQHSLDVEISRLATAVKAFNIVVVPFLVALAAVILAAARVRRRARLTRD